MFHTPPVKMVNTRSTTRRERERKAEEDRQLQLQVPSQPTNVNNTQNNDETKRMLPAFKLSGSSVKSEYRPVQHTPASLTGAKSKSSSSSVLARRKQLELEAAQEKARIQMALIDKKLEADLANLMDEEQGKYSPHDELHTDKQSEVEKWLERSQRELESAAQQVPDYGNQPDLPCPPPVVDPGTSNGTIQMLASALQNLTASTTKHKSDKNLLSRLCTPRDLPSYSGDPLDWLQFKQAYEESTEVCGFSPKENLWRLRKCLHGTAREAVSALMVTATSPDIVMKTLELVCGNPESILTRIMQGLRKLPSMSNEYSKDIVSFSVKVQNFIAAVHAVGRKEYLHDVNMANIILSKLPTVIISKWSDYSFPIITEGKKPRLEILGDFLNIEAVKITTTANIHVMDQRNSYQHHSRNKSDNNNANRPQTVLLQSARSDKCDNKCLFCRGAKHELTECKMFKKALRKDRWRHVKRHGVCFKCLVSCHDRENCPAPACDKDGCGEAHHRLLHYVQHRDTDKDATLESADTRETAESSPTKETVSFININDHKVLLKVVPVKIRGPNGVFTTSAFLDDGSSISLISKSLAARAGLRGRTETMRVSGAWKDSDLECTYTVVSIDVSSLNGSEIFNINLRAVDNLHIPEQDFRSIDCNKFAHLQKLKDKWSPNVISCNPEVLIGQDNYDLIMPLEICKGKPFEPFASRTVLGWSVHGKMRAPHGWGTHAAHNLLIAAEGAGAPCPSAHDDALRDLHEEVRRYFSIDSLGLCNKPRQNSDDVRALAQLDRTTTFADGRWQVGLPWRDENSVMPDSYPNALNRLKGVEKKMAANSEYAQRYTDRVNHLFQNDFAREVSDPRSTSPHTWYLPHHAVDNLNKKKLRLVFDCAAKSKGTSLNEYLLQGPDLLASLFGIMVRFRENRYAVAGDLRDMFLRVKIRPEDQDALRFLWRTDSKQPVKTYAMTSLVFGANSSPFIAQYVKNKNAQRYASTMPAAVAAICEQHYMDDYLDSLPEEAAAIKMVKDVTFIHKQGGFDMCNWTSNSEAVLDSVPKEALGIAALRFKLDRQQEGERTLGLIWYPATDEFGFDLSLKRIPTDIVSGKQVPTKRVMLRVIMSIFDVFGFLSPFTIQGKIMLQSLWQLSIDWDENIPNNIFIKWSEWINLLKQMRYVRIPRCYLSPLGASGLGNRATAEPPSSATTRVAGDSSPARPATAAPPAHTTPPPTYQPRSSATPNAPASTTNIYNSYGNNLEMHIFCDASTKAMCAVAYWRWIYNNEIHVAFIASKCRVLPVKPLLTVPRAELQSALMAARLADSLQKDHRLVVQRRCFWSDSTTFLHWVKNDARNYKTFVANRLGAIDELTRSNEWRYVPTKLNVADIATRETYDDTLFQNEWLKGPSFLRSDESSWPRNIVGSAADEPERSEIINIINDLPATYLPVFNPERFSSWLRLLRSTYHVLVFVHKCRKQTYDDSELMRRAELLLVRQVQEECFGAELAAIRKGMSLERNSRILTWSPYLDDCGVLRCGGRINAAQGVSADTKYPIILDGRHQVTRLLVKHYHVRAAHDYQETVVNNLKEKYAITRIRPTVKHVAARCMYCKIRKAQPHVPVMGELPPGRMAHHQRPFTHCGLDLFGPMEVVVGRGRQKRYGVIFTCLTVRAIHLEIVHSLTTDSLIMALRRMASRRGWPDCFYSDNGTNLRGADTELKRSVQELDNKAVNDFALTNGSSWKFIPPASPHWGGAWERLIRSVKRSLSVVLKERAPKDEVLSTLMAEVENIVNSRPLTHVSVEPGSDGALTPNHFLLHSSPNIPALGVFDDSDLFLRKQWRTSQRLADMYWQRWVKEYLPELLPRRKWNNEQAPLKVGDLVLVVDPGAPRNVWPKAVVQQVFPGRDGRIRLVEIKTKSGVLKRPAARVARIPLVNEC
ncbi:uncharacterized protein LOC134744834 [Cydia strobilella]|uniref:uncharacterized protein LOC134744834 n=2 Tax=Cydia strobilella TaxID=1100964 RepID=UPI0030043514